jgi:hypothetical protein
VLVGGGREATSHRATEMANSSLAFVLDAGVYNLLTVDRLSELQKFILVEAEKSRPQFEKSFGVGDVSHITRNDVLTGFFNLTMRKHQISKAAAGRSRYNSANASLYRAIKRLENRGLILRMSKRRGGMQLTDKGIAVANSLLAAQAEAVNQLAQVS